MTIRQRVIRKQSFLSRIKAYPFDLLLSINEQRELIDWDSHAITFALPLGYSLTFFFFLCTFILGLGTKKETSQYFDYQDFDTVLSHETLNGDHAHTSMLEKLTNAVLLMLWSVCIFNSYRFFTRSRSYYIYNKDFDDNNNASLTKIERSRSFLENVQEYFQLVRSAGTIDTYWELKVWDPSKFSTYLFISFSPLNLMYLRSATPITFSTLFFSLLNSFLLHYLIIFKFTQQVQDKKTLYEETTDEYQRKFVNPRLSTKKLSVGIDATKGPYSDEYVTTEAPGKYQKIFKTHDLKGREVTEFYNEDSREFEVIDANSYGKQRHKRMLSPVKAGFGSYL
ncbi:hypothetical protein WICPIJ_010027 [Wickerhamomyces pijperi]|uniref:Nuclear rim protein 1 n=1 Tax=Wickerhamomyces pijperi TaxID=599730 RepID=A0A9P8PJW5_WICPI|nr:hypothetical protein WICPIJ_010027 [Wickerhamomyces pijperi]